MASGPIPSWLIDRKQWKQWETLFSWAPKSLQMVTAAMKLKDTCSLEKKVMTNPDSIFKSKDITLPRKVHLVKAMVFPVSWMWELGYKVSWALKNWCFWVMVLEETLECPLDCKEIQLVHPKGNQSWIFIGRTDAEAEAPILWPPDGKNWPIWKNPDAGKDWGQEEKGTTEDEMAGWHRWLDGHESEWSPGVADGQGGLECCESWGRKELDTTEWLIWSDLMNLLNAFYTLGCCAVLSHSDVPNSLQPHGL